MYACMYDMCDVYMCAYVSIGCMNMCVFVHVYVCMHADVCVYSHGCMHMCVCVLF